jgi:hypothetical protein
MLAFRLVPLDAIDRPQAAALLIGAVVTLGVLVLGGLFHRRRPIVHAPAMRFPPFLPPQPESRPLDPFTQGSLHERRSAPRRAGNPVTVLVSAAGSSAEPARALILDRSVTGIRLALDQPIGPDTVLRLCPASTLGEVPCVEARVMHCRHVNARWEAGCQFVRTPSWSTLLLFG